MARPLGSQNKDKPFRNALRMAIADAGEDHKRLRRVAEALLEKAESGDVAAIKEIGDRLDGKPTQMVAGDEDGAPILHEIRRVLVRSDNQDG